MGELLLLAIVGDEIKASARDALEFGGAFVAGKIVADAERLALEFVDCRESLAIVWSFGAGNGDALGLGGGIERICAPVGRFSDEDLIFAVVKFETDALQHGVCHGLPRQLSLDGLPISLNGFGIAIGRAGSKSIKRSGKSDGDAEEVFKVFS